MYPNLKLSLNEEDLLNHFTLDLEEKAFINAIKKPENKLGFAVLLKAFQYLGYVPAYKNSIPKAVINHIAGQLKADPASYMAYAWKNRAWDYHVSLIRKRTGQASGSVKRRRRSKYIPGLWARRSRSVPARSSPRRL